MSTWKQRDGTLPYKDWPEIPEQKIYPKCAWKQTNGELPYKEWPNFYTAVPPVSQEEYITVYDKIAPQNEFFESNGLAILTPTEGEITEELNGVYDLMLTHPIDEHNKWRTLLEHNIIKARGQLFRIYKKRTMLNDDGTRERTVYARHISYDLNDKLLEDVRPENKNGHDFIEWIMNHMFDDDPGHRFMFYTFSYDSDIEKTATAYYKNVSPMAALLGEDNCFINRLGGEIHRDNFRFTINTRKEGAVDHVDAIRYGYDMLEVEEDVDYSDYVSLLRVWDNFGNGWGKTVITPSLAHPISRAVTMNYEQRDMAALVSDAENLYDSMNKPKVTYTVKLPISRTQSCTKIFLRYRIIMSAIQCQSTAKSWTSQRNKKLLRKLLTY